MVWPLARRPHPYPHRQHAAHGQTGMSQSHLTMAVAPRTLLGRHLGLGPMAAPCFWGQTWH